MVLFRERYWRVFMKINAILLASALTVAVVSPVWAANSVAREIPLIQTEQAPNFDADVAYLTGGIGDDERAELEAAKADYSLHIINARKSGEYLEDTRTQISRKDGKQYVPLLDVNAGPLLYVKLTPGTYLVEATRYGITKKKNVVIGAKTKARDVGFYWVPPVTEEDLAQ